MAIDILPIPASAVSCERLFSRAKQTATDRRSRLGSDVFEAIECLNVHWRNDLVDYARANTAAAAVEDVQLEEELTEYIPLEEEQEVFAEFPDDDPPPLMPASSSNGI